MRREKIAIDADDVLFDENTAIRLFMNETYGFNHTAQDYDYVGEYWGYWEPIWKLRPEEAEQAYQHFLVSDYKYDLKPMAHAPEVVSRLKENYDLAIVTSRDKPHVEMTHAALRKHYGGIFDAKDVHFVPLWKADSGEKVSKAVIVQAIGADYLIDDNFEHCVGVAETGREALVFGSYGWNRAKQLQPRMTRVLDWLAVAAYYNSIL